MINDLKRELSKLSGVDFFNPKYRDVFKKYLGEEQEGNAEVSRAEELGIINAEEAKEMQEEMGAIDDNQEGQAETTTEEVEKIDEEEPAEDKGEEVEQKAEEIEIEPMTQEDKGEETTESETTEEEPATESEPMKQAESVEVERAHTMSESSNNELLDAKIELGLVRAGVRDDKIHPAMILAKEEIKSIDDLGKIKEIVKQFPEWMHSKDKPAVRGFGMPVDESGDGLTEEEKRFKQLYGQDPRD